MQGCRANDDDDNEATKCVYIGHVSTTLRNALTDNELVQISLDDRYPILKPY
jgi:hypothetical protein